MGSKRKLRIPTRKRQSYNIPSRGMYEVVGDRVVKVAHREDGSLIALNDDGSVALDDEGEEIILEE